jgi:hypothetical protein
MHDKHQTMTGPEFLKAVADAEAANGLPINADVYRERAREWQRALDRISALEAENDSAQRALARARQELQVA